MSSKQNKSARKRGGRGKGTPKPKPRSQGPKVQSVSLDRKSVTSRATAYSTIGTLPRMGVVTSPLTTKHGPGLLVRGMTYVADCVKVNETLSDASAFSPIICSSAVFGDFRKIPIHPFALQALPYSSYPSRLALLAQTFTLFRFRKLRLHYTPGCSTTELNTMAVAYFADPQQTAGSPPGPVSFPAFVDKDGNTLVTQSWSGGAVDFSRELSDEWHYIDLDAGTDAGIRQSIQGVIWAAWKEEVPELSAYSVGTFWIEYDCELTQPYSVQNLALKGPVGSARLLQRRPIASEHIRLGLAERKTPLDRRPYSSTARPAVGDSTAAAVSDSQSDEVEQQYASVAEGVSRQDPPPPPKATSSLVTKVTECSCSSSNK